MYDTDARHPSETLERKLRALYGLRRGGRLEMGFRAPYVRLLESFGNPHLSLPPAIHVAGTNGKGSTVAFLRTILEAGGYRVHAYTSPHLVRFNERIRLSGVEIADSHLEALIDEAMERNAEGEVTFFEITTALAFAAFARAPADIVLLETGLGGRLDCTNIVPRPAACVVTTISGDHREILGDTLGAIAAEKAGIMKPGMPCVVGAQTPAGRAAGVMEVFEARAAEIGIPLFSQGKDWDCEPDGRGGMCFAFEGATQTLPLPGLPGAHQFANAGAALAVLQVLRQTFPLTAQAREQGLRGVIWPARLEHLRTGPLTRILPEGWELWLDGGHNDSAGEALAAQAKAWADADGRPLHLIVGMMGAKNPEEFLGPLLPHLRSFSAVPIAGESAGMDPMRLLEAVPGFPKKHIYPGIREALEGLASPHTSSPARVLICGSLYLAGEVLRSR
jgi:dihydrofolate synthase/folylpolyglutamate synthase